MTDRVIPVGWLGVELVIFDLHCLPEMRDPLLERTLPCRDLAQQRVRRDLQIRTRRRPPGGRIRPRPAGGDLLQRVERCAGFPEVASWRRPGAPRGLPRG